MEIGFMMWMYHRLATKALVAGYLIVFRLLLL